MVLGSIGLVLTVNSGLMSITAELFGICISVRFYFGLSLLIFEAELKPAVANTEVGIPLQKCGLSYYL